VRYSLRSAKTRVYLHVTMKPMKSYYRANGLKVEHVPVRLRPGLDRDKTSRLRSTQNFFLDILLIELIGLDFGEGKRKLHVPKNTIPAVIAGRQSCFLIISSLTLVATAWAASRTVNGLDFQLSAPPKQQCAFQPFHVWQEPDSFFRDLKQVKSKGALQYRRDRDIVASYPDSTTVRVEIRLGVPELSSCSILPPFDPAKLKFHIEWRSDSRTAPANGKVVQWQDSSAQPWCEDKCAGRWVYELRIDSQDVPLQDNLVIRIEAQDGSRLAEYVGKLSTAKLQQQQHPFNIPVSE